MEHTYRLVISCPDRVGIVARVSQFIVEHGGWLTEASYHADPVAGWFFMRTEIKADSLNVGIGEFADAFARIADEYRMRWHLRDSNERQRVVILASQASHCLADILHRWRSDELYCEIPCVISNHDDLRAMVEWHRIPYHHVPVPKHDKIAANAEIAALIEQYRADVVVLARYMQIIPPDLCEVYAGRMLNIHHSFLPSFAGADPYRQAGERGVKLIGATCHYVTPQLDEGPIIEQDVVRVSHRHSRIDMVRLGRDVEKQVLARGLRAHLEDRIIIHGNKTVVFD